MEVKKDVTEKDLNDTIECLKSICKLSHSSTEFIKSTRLELENNKDGDNSSISFLELKNHVMINYLSNLIQIMIKKTDIKSIENCTAINRLIEYRAILEKMRSTQHKLKYQIEKTINISKNNQNVDQALLLKPNIGNLLDEDENETKDQATTTTTSKNKKETEQSPAIKPQTYIVPKINPVEYEYEQSERKAKKEEQLEKAKKRAASTALMKEFRDQFDEDAAPEEVNELAVGRRKSIKQNLNKQEYEENYFVRLAEKKKKRNLDNDNLLTINTLGDNLTHFQDVSVLNENDAEAFAERKKANSKKNKKVKLPKKLAKKLAKRSKKRLNRKKMNL